MRLILVLLIAAVSSTGCLHGDIPPERAVSVDGAAALVWASPYPRLVVEIDIVEGRAPSDLALEAFEANLRAQTDKKEIVILTPTILPPDARFEDNAFAWTLPELVDVHERHFGTGPAFSRGEAGTAFLHVVFLNGRYTSESGGAAGIATSFGIFVWPDTFYTAQVGDVVIPHLQADERDRVVLVHELGHRLGLVNNGAPMLHAREDPHSPHHSRYETSVMYVGNHLPDIVRETTAGDPRELSYTFDEHDLADLQALREQGH